jgi:hypothetical protein
MQVSPDEPYAPLGTTHTFTAIAPGASEVIVKKWSWAGLLDERIEVCMQPSGPPNPCVRSLVSGGNMVVTALVDGKLQHASSSVQIIPAEVCNSLGTNCPGILEAIAGLRNHSEPICVEMGELGQSKLTSGLIFKIDPKAPGAHNPDGRVRIPEWYFETLDLQPTLAHELSHDGDRFTHDPVAPPGWDSWSIYEACHVEL